MAQKDRFVTSVASRNCISACSHCSDAAATAPRTRAISPTRRDGAASARANSAAFASTCSPTPDNEKRPESHRIS